jgi:hypothetical protein
MYFAVEPNGNISPCCDYKLDTFHPVYHKDFPKWYRSGSIHREIYSFTRRCSGCMYGSYPEITTTSRFLRPMARRMLYFNKDLPELKRMPAAEMTAIAEQIFLKNLDERDRADRGLISSSEGHVR